jgi:hypothetical protein
MVQLSELAVTACESQAFLEVIRRCLHQPDTGVVMGHSTVQRSVEIAADAEGLHKLAEAGQRVGMIRAVQSRSRFHQLSEQFLRAIMIAARGEHAGKIIHARERIDMLRTKPSCGYFNELGFRTGRDVGVGTVPLWAMTILAVPASSLVTSGES